MATSTRRYRSTLRQAAGETRAAVLAAAGVVRERAVEPVGLLETANP
ncbi:hypothetical protein [Nocardia sp. NPDC050793]